ncbi:MAG: aldehyde dehydrogenase family protein, partial [Longimicrobiales bacterium]|nr:aldehyde dehydrogenase family protein [Longimicrobiales bacterium]
MSFTSVNPATGRTVATYDLLDAHAVERALATADEAHRVWRIRPVQERAEPLEALGSLLRKRKAELAARMTTEMGKPVSQAIAEAEKCAWVCDYYAENATKQLASTEVRTDASTSYWAYRPLGVILGIMPWNFPLWQVIRFAVPAITAGNAALLKHAPSVGGCAQDLEDLFRDAGYPDGLFANLYIDVDQAGDLIDDPRVRGVSLTGSVGAGKAVAQRAGAALKPCVLELGGSDPSLVLADADLELAARSCALGRFLNTGQSCIAAKRFIVVDEVLDAFQEKILEEMASWQPGDPAHPDTRLGPMARTDLRDTLHDQVVRSVDAGATLVTGG